MKLLILTQKVDKNDAILGFFYDWLRVFAAHCEKVTVICLYKGEYDLPSNVKVLSLGKERIDSRQQTVDSRNILQRFFYIIRFYRYIINERCNYSNVFVHMNPEYVVLGGLFWKLLNKKIALWYTHKAVNFKLRLAEKFTDIIFTASKESFRLPSKKVKVVGHGIDYQKLKIKNLELYNAPGVKIDSKFKIQNSKFTLITVGRISSSKDIKTLIKAVERIKNVKFDVIGGPLDEEDKKYAKELKQIVKEKNLESKINFVGPIPNKDIISYYQDADLFIHASQTGSLDKVVLEAMACGLPVVSCNDAIKNDLLRKYPDLIYRKGDYQALAKRIEEIINISKEKRQELGKELRNIIKNNHSLEKLITTICKNYL
ncbi:glycosyltransferase family 4 protein [Candidatus Parcubacteria bacterium]|nr:glycosyltransferase family 4 protein [Candidatus Parcubacteria bacterium]